MNVSQPHFFSSKVFHDQRGFLKDFQLSTMLSDKMQVQHSFSSFSIQGTIRGMHFQSRDAKQDKLVNCLSGTVLDVVVDIRQDSETFGRIYSEVLGADEKYDSVYIPHGFAHGFQALKDCHLLYMCSENFSAKHYFGINPLCKKFIDIWEPDLKKVLSDKDLSLPIFKELNFKHLM